MCAVATERSLDFVRKRRSSLTLVCGRYACRRVMEIEQAHKRAPL
jgi:hypothetical protein